MRERYLEAFDAIRVDCLNGDKYKTGKTTPEGKPDPSIFSTEHNREGIQVGTAIATLIRKFSHSPAAAVEFRQVWGAAKRQELLDTAEAEPATLYAHVIPPLELGLPFVGAAVGAGYFGWPKLTELLPVTFSGVQTKRDAFVVDIDRERLQRRLDIYFDPKLSNDDMKQILPEAMSSTARYEANSTREYLTKRGFLPSLRPPILPSPI